MADFWSGPLLSCLVAFDHDFAKFIGLVKLENQSINVQLGEKGKVFTPHSDAREGEGDGGFGSGVVTDAGSFRTSQARTGRVSRITGTWTRAASSSGRTRIWIDLCDCLNRQSWVSQSGLSCAVVPTVQCFCPMRNVPSEKSTVLFVEHWSRAASGCMSDRQLRARQARPSEHNTFFSLLLGL